MTPEVYKKNLISDILAQKSKMYWSLLIPYLYNNIINVSAFGKKI